MTNLIKSLEFRFAGMDYGLSARRLWEHTELGQVNVFNQAVSERAELNVAAAFIDLVGFDGDTFALTGLTLEDVLSDRPRPNDAQVNRSRLKEYAKSDSAIRFVGAVGAHLDRCSFRQAVRNQHQPFLPSASVEDCFGVSGIFSTLQRRLLGMGNARAPSDQWLKTIENFQKKGLRSEELEYAELIPGLSLWEGGEDRFSASDLANLCDFDGLRLSVIPVVQDTQRQLRFTAVTARKLTRTKNLSKAVARLPRSVAKFDPVLGYRIEQVEHQTLWGPEHIWQAVTYGGKVIRDGARRTGFQTVEEADELAASHARQHFPKRVALGHYGHYAWTGGESYREWLITLPYFPASYLSGHFEVRNVLAHIRCDLREGADGERVLMLHEVQSDWAQRARRAMNSGESDNDDEVPPPFMKEWSALAMKLVLLHAVHEGLDAVAWTRGAHQLIRYKGLGAAGLIELYDRTLPREVNRIINPFGVACGILEVFVPVNFSVKQLEDGYHVYDEDGELLGTGSTLEDARRFIPDGGHERLDQVHGLTLTADLRIKIIEMGFPAWG